MVMKMKRKLTKVELSSSKKVNYSKRLSKNAEIFKDGRNEIKWTYNHLSYGFYFTGCSNQYLGLSLESVNFCGYYSSRGNGSGIW